MVREVAPSFPIMLVLWGILGYFVYGGVAGALGMVLLSVLCGLGIPVALIPFVGVVIYAILAYNVILPWVLEITGLKATWLTWCIVAFDVGVAVFLTIASSIAVLALMGVTTYNPLENLGIVKKSSEFKFFKKIN